MVTNTRVNTVALTATVRDVEAQLDRVDTELAKFLGILTPSERRATPRVRTGLASAARILANVLATRPEIAAAAEYDRATVLEDLDNLELIAPLLPRLAKLKQRVDDAILRWQAEAQEPTLAAYAVCRARAERDGSLAPLIEPVRRVLANGPAPSVAAPAAAEEADRGGADRGESEKSGTATLD